VIRRLPPEIWDREISYRLTRRAAAAGFDTLFFTVDAPVAGARLRDKRNGFSIPPQLTLGTIASAIPALAELTPGHVTRLARAYPVPSGTADPQG
jgi:isopentenyl diphosphate isomerase/L-lactate dehydrogenase-like FMN-dependent dehydrogenase